MSPKLVTFPQTAAAVGDGGDAGETSQGHCPVCRAAAQGAPAQPSGVDTGEPRKDRKRKEKVRSAWISFAGRIVAQLVGAAATVALGLLIAGRIGPATARTSPAANGGSRGVARPADGRRSLAVLPLQNVSGDPRQEHFAGGLTDALIADLAKIDALRVISRTSSMTYKGQRKSLPQVAQELGVDWIVEGSLVRAGERIRVTAQLVDGRRDEHLWAQSYDHVARDVLALQGEVAAAIAREVQGVLTPGR